MAWLVCPRCQKKFFHPRGNAYGRKFCSETCRVYRYRVEKGIIKGNKTKTFKKETSL